MARNDKVNESNYDSGSARKSSNLLYLLGGLIVLIMVAFGVLYVFGQRLGVQI